MTQNRVPFMRAMRAASFKANWVLYPWPWQSPLASFPHQLRHPSQPSQELADERIYTTIYTTMGSMTE